MLALSLGAGGLLAQTAPQTAAQLQTVSRTGPETRPHTVPGAESPAYQDALARWLADDEGPALADLRALAVEGNAAARLLLALIDKTPSLQGPALAYLPRTDRIALLRQPGGMSGRSWLHALTDVPLAQAWMGLMDTAAGLEVMQAFVDLGEPRAAREAFLALAAREHPALRDMAPADAPPDLRYLLWRGADADRQAQILAQVPADDPQHRFMDQPGLGLSVLADWLATAPAARPLSALCAVACPDTPAACLTAAYQALGSHGALMTLGSPADALVTQDEFATTPRGRAATMRRILLSVDARGRRMMMSRLAQTQQCLSTALEAEAARFRYPRNGTPAPVAPN